MMIVFLKILVFFSFAHSEIKDHSQSIDHIKNNILLTFKTDKIYFIHHQDDQIMNTFKNDIKISKNDLLTNLDQILDSPHSAIKEKLIFMTIGHGTKNFLYHGNTHLSVQDFETLFKNLQNKFEVYTILTHCHSGSFFHMLKNIGICGIFSTIENNSSYGCLKNDISYNDLYLIDLILISISIKNSNMKDIINLLHLFNTKMDLPHLSSDLLINEYLKNRYITHDINNQFNEIDTYFISFFYSFWEKELHLSKVNDIEDFDQQINDYYQYLLSMINIDDSRIKGMRLKLNLLHRMMIYINRIKINKKNLSSEENSLLYQMDQCEMQILSE